MSYRFVDSFRAGPGWSCSTAVYKPVWHIPVPSVQWINFWWWAEELPETCRVSCRSKFGKLVHLLGFTIKKVVRIIPCGVTEITGILYEINGSYFIITHFSETCWIWLNWARLILCVHSLNLQQYFQIRFSYRRVFRLQFEHLNV